jgi:hypothetical protein
MKTYTLICPDPDCADEFDIKLEPADLSEDGDLIECPTCFEEWEWSYAAETDTLTLVADEEFDETDLTDESGEGEDDEN